MKGLKDKPDLLGPEFGTFILAHRAQLLTIEIHRAGRGLIQPGKQSQERRLAASRWAQDGEKVARLETKGDILQDRQVLATGPVGPAQGLAVQHGIRHSRMILRHLFLSVFAVALFGCEQPKDEAAATPAPPDTTHQRPAILFLGTSLTAGYGIGPERAYPALIQQKIDAAGLDYRVINAGVSGETSAGARRRVDWLMQQPVSVLVVETGANDGLRGLPADSLRANIQAILDRARQLQPSARLVLLGMRVPPNYGRAYSEQFQTVYHQLARTNQVTLVPFLLEGVGGIRALNQPDGVHPTVEGQRQIAETVWRGLEPVLRESGQGGKGVKDGRG